MQPKDFVFKTAPFSHQRAEFEEHALDPVRGLLWEQGTGKSKEVIDTAALLFLRGEIDALFLLAPNGVHRNWVVNELPIHLAEEVAKRTRALFYQTSKSETKWHQRECKEILAHEGLAVVTMSYDAIMTDTGSRFAKALLTKRRCFYVLDESSSIKSMGTKRTKRVLASSEYAKYKRVLDGTPVHNAPFDIYSQLQFLDKDFWDRKGFGSYVAYKQNFGVFRPITNPRFDPTRAVSPRNRPTIEIVKGYRNLDQLRGIVGEICGRVRKDEVLDLPPKLYSKRYFEMTPEQERLYRDLRDTYMAELDQLVPCSWCEPFGAPQSGCELCHGSGQMKPLITADLAIVRMLRLQQITCGYAPSQDGAEVYDIPGRNPRLEALVETVCQAPGKVIVWARFRRDIDLMMEALRREGRACARYDGAVKDEERGRAIANFQGEGDTYIDTFVANPAVGATGFTLHAASTVIYYNNDFKLRNRLQSEDRPHRIGLLHPVSYIDLVAPGTVDEHVVNALVRKLDIASLVVGDDFKEWLR